MTTHLLMIGDFAREAGLTPKALRLYDDLGLLRPVEVDPVSGYRRYSGDQVADARLVATLRLVGMPLARIAKVLDARASGRPSTAVRELRAYWVQVEADTASRRDVVSALLRQLEDEESTMDTDTRPLHVDLGTSHHRGRRDRQQDAVVATATHLAVADGFGSRDDLAAAALAAWVAGGLDEALAEVTADITAGLPGAPTSGTTLTGVVLDGSAARVVHVGDGRVWLVRDAEVEQVTHDHTVVAALIESGQLTVEEARSHEHRSLLNRALGPGVVADEVVLDLRPGDRLALTTDGVHAVVDDLAPLLLGDGTAQDVADAIGAAVAAAGEPDNHTVVVADLA
ncbi:MerR family transcriptional regulator [Nocardioides zeicaulis]|uniref:MerR family transcriptional regulator n=1 Tax=Nocardioides zeicaulis TaxID=1776857 RepID=A0ABV6DWN8_9ACTN